MQPDPSHESDKNDLPHVPLIRPGGSDFIHEFDRLNNQSDARNIPRAPLIEPGEEDFVYDMDRIHKEKKYAPKMYRKETLLLILFLVGFIVLLMILGSTH